MRIVLLLILLIGNALIFAQKNASVSFEKWISLKTVSNPVISPDGKTIVYTQNTTDWANNSYDSELWMAREGETPFQLTRTNKGSSFSADFTPDGKFVSFLANRGDKIQLFLISIQGGEAIQVTRDEEGISSYDWSPDGNRIVYSKAAAESKQEKTTKDRYGAFAAEGKNTEMNISGYCPSITIRFLWPDSCPAIPLKKTPQKKKKKPNPVLYFHWQNNLPMATFR
jgi:dipeptidyl aminopeptidase/acylaminoacyl peptidase